MREKEVVKKLKEHLPNKVFFRRHEDKFLSGIPDIELCYEGVTSWVEVKGWERVLSRRKSVEVIGTQSYQLKPIQYKELLTRVDHGQRAYLAIGTDIGVVLYPAILVPHRITRDMFYQEYWGYSDWWRSIF